MFWLALLSLFADNAVACGGPSETRPWAPRPQAKRLGLRDPDFGAVCFTQRFRSALNLNAHFHALVLDGTYALDADDVPRLHVIPRLTVAEAARLVQTIRRRAVAYRRMITSGRPLGRDGETGA